MKNSTHTTEHTKMPKSIVDHRHPDVQDLIQSTVRMCLDTINNPELPDMPVNQRSTFVQHVNRLLECLTSKTSYVIHSHYYENKENTPNLAGLGPSSSSLARSGDEIVAAQERGGPRPESLRA